MDPESTLRNAQECLESFVDNMIAYRKWRMGGGFEPKDVDDKTGDFLYELMRSTNLKLLIEPLKTSGANTYVR